MSAPNSPMKEICCTEHRPFENKEVLRCMFCGGKTCKRCGPDAYLAQESPALEKIHSSWITESIIAMQRPCEDMFTNSNLLEQLRKYRITAIFNLTEAGEHPFCGKGNQLYSGFPYNPETLMKSGIKHFNYCWRDMTVPPMSLMMDIVQVAQNELSRDGRIAVHCHAGYGRTGLAIACILIAMDQFSSEEAIRTVRQQRPGSIQTQMQQDFIFEFERHWRQVSTVFPSKQFPQCEIAKSITKSVKDQFYSLSLEEFSQDNLKYIGKIVSLGLSGIEKFAKKISPSDCRLVCAAMSGLKVSSDNQLEYFKPEVSENYFAKVVNEINANNWATLLSSIGDLFTPRPDSAIVIGLVESNQLTSEIIRENIVFSLSQFVYMWFSTRSDSLVDGALLPELKSTWRIISCKFFGESLNINKTASGSSSASGASGAFDSMEAFYDFAFSNIVRCLDASLNRTKLFHFSIIVGLFAELGKANVSMPSENSEVDNESSEVLWLKNALSLADLALLRLCVVLLRPAEIPFMLSNR